MKADAPITCEVIRGLQGGPKVGIIKRYQDGYEIIHLLDWQAAIEMSQVIKHLATTVREEASA